MVTENAQRTIGKQLAMWRERAGLGLEQSSTKLNMPISVLKGVEAGLVRTPRRLLEAFAQAYQASEPELRTLLDLESGHQSKPSE